MELLSPAGSLEKLKYAIHYGADAVYAAGKKFGLRAKSLNFTDEELKEAINLVHASNKKIYITVNIFAHNRHIPELEDYLSFLESIKPDALIISDPAIFELAREIATDIPIHISTQANVTSWRSVKFWHKMGAERVILARELTIDEIKEIKDKVPEMELEMFVHGAMCMSYSGRCLLSAFLNGRHANLGDCSQPCRWKYHLMEEKRPGEYFPIVEDDYGTYILNSKDLCLIDRLQEIKDAGISSIKIEGRMKSIYYVANVVRTYRKALDNLDKNILSDKKLYEELDKVSHRTYTHAFFDSFDSTKTQYYKTSSYVRTHKVLGYIIDTMDNNALLDVRNKFFSGDTVEMIFPDLEDDKKFVINKIIDQEGNKLQFTKPNTIVKLELPFIPRKMGILRKKIEV
jgi:putative protease